MLMETIGMLNGEAVTVRSNRIKQVRDFIESGEPEREIFINECEMLGTVRATLHNTIMSRPYFKTRCYAEQRNSRLYLVRRNMDG